MNEFNKHTNKNYNKTQLTQKYQRMKGRHGTFSQLIARTGMGWDPISNIVTASEEAWAAAFVVSPLTYSKQNLLQLALCIVYGCN